MALVRYGLVLWAALAMAAGDPGWYTRGATWQETLVASREALARQKPAGPRVPLPDFGRDDFTLAAWVRTTAGGTLFATAPAKGNWARQGKALFIRGGKLCYDIGWVGVLTSQRSVADGAWHHVALTGPNDYRFYIDGAPDTAGRLDAQPDPSGFVARIGFTSPNFPESPFFTGALDELRVYRRRLSAEEIRALAGTGQAPGGSGAARPADMTAGAADGSMAAHWAFEGDTADGAGGQVCALQGKGASYAAGHAGQALVLAGDTYLQVGAGKDSLHDDLWVLLKRDFPDARSAEEMAWEQEDRIYDADWRPGDRRELAGRYARATRGEALRAQAGRLAQGTGDAAGLRAVRALYLRSRKLEGMIAGLRALDLDATRQAITHLAQAYGSAYPRGKEYLARLDALEQPIQDALRKAEAGDLSAEERILGAGEELPRLRHEALVSANPLLGFGRILFIKRKTYQASHYYTDYIDGCRDFGGNLCILSLHDGRVTELVPELRDGIFGRFDLSYDATHVVFDYKAAPEQGFRIYEVGIDGRGLRQLTFPPPNEQELIDRYRNVRTPTGIPYQTGTDDMHPCYLPDGDIVFVSTRCEKGILCDGPDVLTTTVLYRMDRDGGHMRPLSFNTVSEATPSITQDGRILYTRWEYVDKGGSACKCIWVMNPDGTGSAEVYANNITHPTTFIDARDIPGSPGAFVVVGAPHMPMGVGSIIRLDTSRSLRTLDPMTNLTPEIDTPDEHGFRHLRDGEWVHDLQGPLFREPYPLSPRHFLVAYNPDQPWNEPAGYGIYLLDEWGNRELIYRDPEFSCWSPTPLRPRPQPPIIPPASREASTPQPAPAGTTGMLVLQDVYVGLTGIERGRVKYLRVMEDVPRPWSARRTWPGDERKQQHAVVSMDGHLAPKIVHGVVPVAPDGSAYFRVPADRNLFFQALDENYMELQRMRSFVNLRPGEVRGCVGCHEEKRVTPTASHRPLAMLQPAADPAPQPGETVPRTVDYMADVQPILDRHCVRCHSGAGPSAGLNLEGTLTAQFCRSYEELITKKLAGNVIDEIGQKHGYIQSADPLTYGSHTSKLVANLRKPGGQGRNLSQAEWCRLLTWIDADAPYYGSWQGRRNLRYRAFPDFRPAPPEGTALVRLRARELAGDEPPVGIRHPFLCSDNGQNKVFAVSADGRIEWEYPATFGQDVWALPNGHFLFSNLHGAQEVTRDKEVVWEYRSPEGTEVHNCQPLPDGAVLICECGTRRLIEVGRDGKIRKEIPVETKTPAVHMQFRIARKLANGHYLVAFVGERLVRELDGEGKVVRTIPTPGDVFVAIRLPDGNTLIGCGDGHQVIEVDPSDRVVWQIDENEIPGIPLRFVAGLQRLPNGNTVVCNWGGHGHVGEQALLFEITRDKKLVWVMDDTRQFRTLSNVQLLDVPGDVTKGEILR